MNESELTLLRREVHRVRQEHRAQRLLLLVALASVAALAIAIVGRPHSVAAQSAPEKDSILTDFTSQKRQFVERDAPVGHSVQ